MEVDVSWNSLPSDKDPCRPWRTGSLAVCHLRHASGPVASVRVRRVSGRR